MEDKRLAKVEILIQQKKYSNAEKILSDLLKEDATNIHFLSLLSEVYLHQEKFDKSNQIIENAIGLSPETSYLYYIKSRIAFQKDNLIEAEKIIYRAIELDPLDADFFALLSSIKLSRKEYEFALSNANKALEIDPENILALNIRSTALNKLNRKEESFETIEGALREDPNNVFTHTNYGWGLLEKGDHKKALIHFKEALSIDPNFEYAQSGMLEAIKAANPIYKIFLKYSFWMSNLTSKYQWGVLIGYYIAFKGLRTLANQNETLRPYLIPILILLGLIAFSTWVITPISNLFLRFNKYGQLLLDKKEKMSSNFVAFGFGLFIFGVISFFAFSNEKFLTIAVFGFTMMVPFGTMFSSTKMKNILLIYTSILAIIGISAIWITFQTDLIFNLMTIIYLVAFVFYQWIASFLLIKEDNK